MSVDDFTKSLILNDIQEPTLLINDTVKHKNEIQR